MMRIYELYDKVPQAVLYLKKDDGSLTKVCDVKNIKHVNPTYIPDEDDYIHKIQESLPKVCDVNDINLIPPRLIPDEIYSFKTQIDKLNKIIADNISKTVFSYKVICTTIKHQNRTHHKYRTNKKWAKRYGYYYIEVQDEPIIIMNDTIYCTKDGFDQIKKICK